MMAVSQLTQQIKDSVIFYFFCFRCRWKAFPQNDFSVNQLHIILIVKISIHNDVNLVIHLLCQIQIKFCIKHLTLKIKSLKFCCWKAYLLVSWLPWSAITISAGISWSVLSRSKSISSQPWKRNYFEVLRLFGWFHSDRITHSILDFEFFTKKSFDYFNHTL